MSGNVLLYAVIGLAIAALGVPLWMRRIGPNHLYGVRTSTTLTDKRIWYDVNAGTGRDMVIIGSFTLALALVLDAYGIAGATYSLTMGCAIVLGAGTIALSGLSRCKDAGRRKDRGTGENRQGR